VWISLREKFTRKLWLFRALSKGISYCGKFEREQENIRLVKER